MPEAVLQRRAGAGQLVLLLAGSCLSVLGAVLIAPVLPQMTDHFAGVAGADVLVPIVLTVPALVIGLTAPFAGFVVDALDRKRLLIAAMIGYAICGTAPLYLDSLPAIIGSRVLVGLCEAAIMTCCTTLIADYWSGRQRSRYLGLQTLLASVSATIFLGVGGAIGASGWRAPFWLYTVALALAVPMSLLIWQPVAAASTTTPAPPPGAPSLAPPAGALSAAPPGGALAVAPPPGAKPKLPPLPWRQLRTPCLVTLAGGIVFYALIVELSFVLDEVGVTETATIGALSALMSLATAIAAGSFARLSARTPRQLLPIAFGLAALGFLIIAATEAVPVITLGAVLTGAGTGLLLPTLLTWATNSLTFEERGRGTGLWTGTLFVGEFLSPVLINGLSAAAGGLRPALGILGVLTVILAAAMPVIVPRTAPALNVTTD
ncbi:MFS transporter [Actinoplanes ianthinogenes]|uniref:MFS transporter n=1 Tax=Actinoplanes ianthinogenes TaxID=122358 RepID=A0ABN6CMI1_9ACTN|nr:MFS transporter [Actinoplanes ianthinogenes]BCJ46280.1 MFS transporter [Actinoplanes ianthinogenes]GGR27567.1 MFS transporter [Actinoplanes ianthinogenes]